jgi:NAD(P)-dependent dehydrogenase (short-subunit alcohol dehydrogenase family)
MAGRRSLQGRTVAVTGGARGIGRATASALVARGARVAIGDLDGDLAEQVAADLGAGAVARTLDVTDRDGFDAFLDDVEAELGPLDALVNNAGIVHLGAFVDEDDAWTRRQFDVNVYGVVNGMRAALPRMRARGRGHVVNVASSAGKLTPPGIATYAATKHAVVGLTEAVRLEHRGTGVDFSIVMPGVVKTDMIAGYADAPGRRDVEPEDVAAAIVGALERPRVDVWVPRSLGALHRAMSLVPRPVREAAARALGVERVTWDFDASARRAYEERAAASDPRHVPPVAGR